MRKGVLILVLFQVVAFGLTVGIGTESIKGGPWWQFAILFFAVAAQVIACAITATYLRPSHYPPRNDHTGDVA